MRRVLASLLLPVLFAGLSGCQTAPQEEVAVVQPRPQGIDGRWTSIGGPVPYTATFQGGRFTTTENATSALLAEGSYTSLGPGQVTITYTSRRTNQRVAANCNQTGPNTLACATSANSRFELSRA
ncbi:hypothetical protein [Antarcticirhabdus aurantiaca]|uniref:Uncharacterized protein n=1 Tax=Antarcticirhabdus aurantiaca TaxID=2606717 RepID=A0ACD4NV05_9HYPH|nr:hypothetical protein [Antarcticirhabdus aurantiaca]WAJ30545.1 hypothetical protein OXU80_10210 [Jeongeuplla avenae]